MISHKWFYSYRILTARLRAGADADTAQTSGLDAGSAVAQAQSLSDNAAPGEAKAAKPALLVTAGGKM
jgi:hypothetical protein